MQIPVTDGLILGGTLFLLGLLCILVRRNIIFMLMGVEIMLNSAGIIFVFAGQQWNQPDGQIFFIFILTMAAAEVSVGLAIILQMYHHFNTVDTDSISSMKG